jgi:hypothetical protein
VNDIKDVLEQALDHLPPAGATADPGPDLARGKSLLRRRRKVRAAGVAAACVVVAVALVPALSSGSPASHATYGAISHHGARVPAHSAVGLVAYPGPQPQGYTVKEIPKGWVIQGSTPSVITIAPANDPDKDVDSFLGKLIVTWEQLYSTSGTPVKVAGGRGYYTVQNAQGVLTQGLTWKDAHGHWLLAQAPTSLGWNEAEFAAFAAGVTVLPGAQPSVG